MTFSESRGHCLQILPSTWTAAQLPKTIKNREIFVPLKLPRPLTNRSSIQEKLHGFFSYFLIFFCRKKSYWVSNDIFSRFDNTPKWTFTKMIVFDRPKKRVKTHLLFCFKKCELFEYLVCFYCFSEFQKAIYQNKT